MTTYDPVQAMESPEPAPLDPKLEALEILAIEQWRQRAQAKDEQREARRIERARRDEPLA